MRVLAKKAELLSADDERASTWRRIGEARRDMLEDVWGLHEDTDTRAIDNFIVRLRRYIEDSPSRPQHVLTVRGVGYKFVAEPGEAGAKEEAATRSPGW